MNSIWPIIFICSSLGLAFFVFKVKWLSIAIRIFVVNMVLGLIVIYAINYSGWVNEVYIPINYTTMTTVGLLGIPGVVLLVGLKLILF